MAKENDHKIFNIKKRWLRRSHIPGAELYSSVILIALTAITGFWFFSQKDNYDYNERDLDPALLAGQTTLELYTRPLKLWQEPGSVAGPITGPSIEPFPAATIDPEWRLAGRLRSFQPDNLFEKINGEAEKFLKLNFQQLYYLVLKANQGRAEIAIELYDHGDVTHSIGIFSSHTSASSEILNAGDVTYFETGAGMIGRKGKYFFRVAASEFNETVKLKTNQLAQAFDQLGAVAQITTASVNSEGANSDMPLEFRVLSESLNIPEDAIAFSAQNVFQFDFASNFWFGNLADSEGRVFVHLAGSAMAAQELYGQLLVEFEFDYALVEQLQNGVLLKHRFLNNFLVMQTQGAYLFGAENMTDRDALPQLLSQLSEGVNERP
jgi:hypothetical protein